MRISYSDEEDFPGQFGLWNGNCQRSLRGKSGQRELLALKNALLALPSKRLILGSLIDSNNEVCAIGAYARAQGLDLSNFDPTDSSDDVGIEAGMPRLVAWMVVEVNDLDYDHHYTPEQRYLGVLAWIEKRLSPK